MTAETETFVAGGLTPEEERQVAVDLFNHTWELLETSDRTPAQDDRMLHAAHASRLHWERTGTPREPGRGGVAMRPRLRRPRPSRAGAAPRAPVHRDVRGARRRPVLPRRGVRSARPRATPWRGTAPRPRRPRPRRGAWPRASRMRRSGRCSSRTSRACPGDAQAASDAAATGSSVPTPRRKYSAVEEPADAADRVDDLERHQGHDRRADGDGDDVGERDRGLDRRHDAALELERRAPLHERLVARRGTASRSTPKHTHAAMTSGIRAVPKTSMPTPAPALAIAIVRSSPQRARTAPATRPPRTDPTPCSVASTPRNDAGRCSPSSMSA